jgi:hypothetical protein
MKSYRDRFGRWALLAALFLFAAQAGCFAIGWNFVLVTLFHCAPISFWMALPTYLFIRWTVRQGNHTF